MVAKINDFQADYWAKLFWTLAGEPESFPRSLEKSVALALPLAIVKLPSLGLCEFRDWLFQRGIEVHVTGPDRRLRACLVAKAGRGLVALDGSDPEDERRISLAHEVAHFLIDYLHPHQKALELLGESAREVLDGERQPTLKEELTGILRGVELGVYTNLIERPSTGSINNTVIIGIEDRAERVALELLAPFGMVLETIIPSGTSQNQQPSLAMICDVLSEHFGLPSSVAKSYGQYIINSKRLKKTFREWLGM
jgi:hypothetical protein